MNLADRSLNDYAVFGGQPAFTSALHVNKPWVGRKQTFDAHVNTAWENRWFSNEGSLQRTLESKLAQRLGVRNCVLVSNGTAAMGLVLAELGISGEVILPSFTFISTPHQLVSRGIRPVYCDIDPATGNMSAAHCERLITDKTGAIIPTHLWGRACDVDAFEHVSRRRGIPLIFDAAHGFDCSYGGRKIGGFGNAEVFSFHATKSFHTAEGGAITCTDDDLADRLRRARNFGFVGPDRVAGVGTNAKMSELSAAMGLTNLESFDDAVAQSRDVYLAYRDALADNPNVSLIPFNEQESNNFWYIALTLSPSCPISRDDVTTILRAENVLARRYFYPGCHRMEPFLSAPDAQQPDLPATEQIAKVCFTLPGGPEVTPQIAHEVCMLLDNIIKNGARLTQKLRAQGIPAADTALPGDRVPKPESMT